MVFIDIPEASYEISKISTIKSPMDKALNLIQIIFFMIDNKIKR